MYTNPEGKIISALQEAKKANSKGMRYREVAKKFDFLDPDKPINEYGYAWLGLRANGLVKAYWRYTGEWYWPFGHYFEPTTTSLRLLR